MTYDEALNFILNKQSLGIKPGLSRIKALLNHLQNPQDKIKIIHIAGTNGKGTVASTIYQALINNGLKVGLFTSPWIYDYKEQIQINNNFIDENYFANFVANNITSDCTEFEFITAMMYSYFAYNNVDYAIVECGMGGLGDSTNVEKQNVCSVLTSISLDHIDFLGNTVEKIRQEKQGIVRPNAPCFDYENTNNALDFNARNLLLAKQVLAFLGFNDNVQLAKLPARQQRINGILLDGGHNVEAGKALAQIINNEVAVIAMMRDKNIDGYLSLIAPKCKKIICTTTSNSRSLSANDLMLVAKKYCSNVCAIDNPQIAVKQNGVSLVCGSLYLARDVINLI